jgi:formate dehydrogenase major subunit
MELPVSLSKWPVWRQLRGHDHLGLDDAVRSPRTDALRGRVATADRVVPSVCPYCAVGCGQRVFVQDGEITQIEGDPDSPISRGRLCPKGAATRGLVQSPSREYRVKYRRPFGTDWEELGLERAMDLIAERVIRTRAETWQQTDEEGHTLRRTMGVGMLGGATLDNEENYLLKKLATGLGIVQIENQARI